MKIIKNGGGTSIGVYNIANSNLDRVRDLLKQQRIDYFTPADYTEGSRIEKIVKNIIYKIDANEKLIALNKRQDEYIYGLERTEYFYDYMQDFLDDNELDLDSLRITKKQALEILRKFKKKLCEYDDIAPIEVNDRFVDVLRQELNKLFKEEKQAILQEYEPNEVELLDGGKTIQ